MNFYSERTFREHGIYISLIILDKSSHTKWQSCTYCSHLPCTAAAAAAAAAKSLQSCPTLCNPIDGSPPGFPIPGILQARTLEWAAISFSSAWKWKVKVKSLSRVWLLVIPWTAAHQAPPSMGFSRQENWSGVPLPSPPMHCRHIAEDWSWFSPHNSNNSHWPSALWIS